MVQGARQQWVHLQSYSEATSKHVLHEFSLLGYKIMRNKVQRMVLVRCTFCRQSTAHGLCGNKTVGTLLLKQCRQQVQKPHLPSGLGP